jgi:hypothetical protein
MDIEEMKVYIDTLEKENEILRERNDKLYEQNCNQARLLSNTLNDDSRRYFSMVAAGDFNGTKRLYNNVITSNTASTDNFRLTPILYV